MWYTLLIAYIALAIFGSDRMIDDDPEVRIDTVQHRYAIFKLPDETSIEYWFGQMTLSNARGIRFLHFNDAVLNGYLMESEPFEARKGDSLFYRRVVVFSNPAKRFASGQFQIMPDTSMLNSRSNIRFVVELENPARKRRTPLDTVTCFVNERGEMRFSQSAFDMPFRLHNLSRYTGPSRVLVRLDTSGINAPVVLDELRRLDQQSAMDPYQTTMFSHQVTVLGFDVDSLSGHWGRERP